MDWQTILKKVQKVWHYIRMGIYIIAALWITWATLYLLVDIFQRRFGLFK